MLPSFQDLHAGLEPLALNLLCDFVAFLRFRFCDTLDVEHLLLGAIDKGDRVK